MGGGSCINQPSNTSPQLIEFNTASVARPLRASVMRVVFWNSDPSDLAAQCPVFCKYKRATDPNRLSSAGFTVIWLKALCNEPLSVDARLLTVRVLYLSCCDNRRLNNQVHSRGDLEPIPKETLV
jgi:hypothetical protein